MSCCCCCFSLQAYGNAGKFVDFPDNLQSYFRKLKPEEQNRVTITGYQEHDQLKEILPLASVCIVGSKATEAFGMVSLEAMAAGVFPLCNDHSGLSEVLEAVREVEPDLESKMRLKVRPGGSRGTADGAFLIEQLPDKIEAVLRLMYPNGFKNHEKRKEISGRLRQFAVKDFSWDQLCEKISNLKDVPDV
jgi:glycosyltransferase involved in cell wall biosynthesis